MPFPTFNRFGIIDNPLLCTPFVANDEGEASNNEINGVRVTEVIHEIRITQDGYYRVIEHGQDNAFLLLGGDQFLLLGGENFNLL